MGKMSSKRVRITFTNLIRSTAAGIANCFIAIDSSFLSLRMGALGSIYSPYTHTQLIAIINEITRNKEKVTSTSASSLDTKHTLAVKPRKSKDEHASLDSCTNI